MKFERIEENKITLETPQEAGGGKYEREISNDAATELSTLLDDVEGLLRGENVEYGTVIKRIESRAQKIEGRFKRFGFLKDVVEYAGEMVKAMAVTFGVCAGIGGYLPTGVVAGGLGIGFEKLAQNINDKTLSKKVTDLSLELHSLLTAGRKITDARLMAGGAQYDKQGRLEVTPEQIEAARKEGE